MDHVRKVGIAPTTDDLLLGTRRDLIVVLLLNIQEGVAQVLLKHLSLNLSTAGHEVTSSGCHAVVVAVLL